MREKGGAVSRGGRANRGHLEGLGPCGHLHSVLSGFDLPPCEMGRADVHKGQWPDPWTGRASLVLGRWAALVQVEEAATRQRCARRYWRRIRSYLAVAAFCSCWSPRAEIGRLPPGSPLCGVGGWAVGPGEPPAVDLESTPCVGCGSGRLPSLYAALGRWGWSGVVGGSWWRCPRE